MRLRMILLALGLALAALWVAAFLDSPVSVVVVRPDDPPYNVNVTTSLGHSCVTPCSLLYARAVRGPPRQARLPGTDALGRDTARRFDTSARDDQGYPPARLI
jgi:hypothetical protein